MKCAACGKDFVEGDQSVSRPHAVFHKICWNEVKPILSHGRQGTTGPRPSCRVPASGYRGVLHRPKSAKQPWIAIGSYLGAKTYLGGFTTREDAARAYDAFARARWGKNAITNFDEGD